MCLLYILSKNIRIRDKSVLVTSFIASNLDDVRKFVEGGPINAIFRSRRGGVGGAEL
jgi:hypothetical protein